MEQAQRIDAAFLAISEALGPDGRPREKGRAGDISLVRAGQELCGALRGFGDAFWAEMIISPQDIRVAVGILDDYYHAQKYVLPLCAKILRALGFRPPRDAEGFVNQAVLAYTAARQAAPNNVEVRVAEARWHVDALTDAVCRLSQAARVALDSGNSLNYSQHARMGHSVSRGRQVLASLLICLGTVADVAQVQSYYEDHHQGQAVEKQQTQKQSQDVERDLQRLSPAGRNAIKILGLNEAVQQSQVSQHERSDEDVDG